MQACENSSNFSSWITAYSHFIVFVWFQLQVWQKNWDILIWQQYKALTFTLLRNLEVKITIKSCDILVLVIIITFIKIEKIELIIIIEVENLVLIITMFIILFPKKKDHRFFYQIYDLYINHLNHFSKFHNTSDFYIFFSELVF